MKYITNYSEGKHMKDIKYKHELVTVEELMKKTMTPVMMLFDKIPAYRRKSDNNILYPEAVLPDSFVVTQVNNASNGEDGSVYIHYYDIKDKKNKEARMHKTTQFAKLIGTKSKDVVKETRNAMFEDIENHLAHAFYIGSDPEIFVEDKNGQVIPAFKFLGSKTDKKNQTFFASSPSNVYWDGFQAEMETYAASCLEQQSASVQQGMVELLKAARAYDKNARLSTKTVMEIPKEMREEAKPEHVSLGCMPSYNVYGMQGELVADPRMLPIRPAGGHIHFGIGKSTHEEVKDIVKALDAILGVCCVSLFQKYDDPIRRQYYGLAGEYRLPPHGLEYRTLSNAWMIHPILMNFVFDLSRKVLMFGKNGYMDKWNATEAETITCINTCDVKLAHEIMERNKGLIIKLFKAAYQNWTEDEKAFEALYSIFFKGLDVIVDKPNDFEGNWNMLGGSSLYSPATMRNFKNNVATIITKAKKKAA